MLIFGAILQSNSTLKIPRMSGTTQPSPPATGHAPWRCYGRGSSEWHPTCWPTAPWWKGWQAIISDIQKWCVDIQSNHPEAAMVGDMMVEIVSFAIISSTKLKWVQCYFLGAKNYRVKPTYNLGSRVSGLIPRCVVGPRFSVRTPFLPFDDWTACTSYPKARSQSHKVIHITNWQDEVLPFRKGTLQQLLENEWPIYVGRFENSNTFVRHQRCRPGGLRAGPKRLPDTSDVAARCECIRASADGLTSSMVARIWCFCWHVFLGDACWNGEHLW